MTKAWCKCITAESQGEIKALLVAHQVFQIALDHARWKENLLASEVIA